MESKETEDQKEDVIDYRDVNWHKASEKYLDSYHQIDLKQRKNKLALIADMTKGLLSFKGNHVATEAILSGVPEKGKALWKMIYWGVVPILSFYLISIIVGLAVSNGQLSVGTALTSILISIASSLLIFAPLSWLSVISHAWCMNFISGIIFKKKSQQKEISLILGTWILMSNYIFAFVQVLIFILLMSFGSSGAIAGGILSIMSFIMLMIGCHRSIGYTLGINGWKAFLTNVFIFGAFVALYIAVVSMLDPEVVNAINEKLMLI